MATEGDSTLLRAFWEGNSQTEASQDIVRDLREIDPAEGEALVGGTDRRHRRPDRRRSASHLLWMGLIVVGVMLVLLFLAFGSVVLPIKAVVMNAGLDHRVVRGRHLDLPGRATCPDLLGFEPQGYLDATNPILMLAILFGLSMDYEVFLLSRVREQWDRTHDNDLAVATGVQKTGRIITSAALLLAVVIGAFGLSRHRVHEDDRHRHAGRPAHRRHRRPGAAGARDDEAARPTGTGGRPARCGAGGSSTASARPTRHRAAAPRDLVRRLSAADPTVV